MAFYLFEYNFSKFENLKFPYLGVWGEGGVVGEKRYRLSRHVAKKLEIKPDCLPLPTSLFH